RGVGGGRRRRADPAGRAGRAADLRRRGARRPAHPRARETGEGGDRDRDVLRAGAGVRRPRPAGNELPRARRDDGQPRGQAAAPPPGGDPARPGRDRLDREARRAVRRRDRPARARCAAAGARGAAARTGEPRAAGRQARDDAAPGGAPPPALQPALLRPGGRARRRAPVPAARAGDRAPRLRRGDPPHRERRHGARPVERHVRRAAGADRQAARQRHRARRGRARPRARRARGGEEAAVSHTGEPWWIGVIKALIIVNILLLAMAFLTLLERKVLARMQRRYGPNRAGPKGILQPFADLIKMVRKEAFAPMAAIDVLYLAAPAFSAFTALAAFSVIPFGEGWQIWHYHVNGEVADVPISLILIFALGSLGIYGFIIGGWASESKYSLLGSMRTCAQMVSYEVSLALSVLGVVLMAHTLSISQIVDKQVASWWYAAPQFVGLLCFFIAGVAETNRPPFDLPEADTELVGGYSTEYSGMRWGLFQMAEYVNVIVLSA